MSLPSPAPAQQPEPPSEAGLLDPFETPPATSDAENDQEAVDTETTTKSVPETAETEQSLNDIPDSYLREADEFFKYCSATPKLSEYYNCECLAVEFLNQRVSAGPEMPRTTIMLNIRSSCHDATNAAGMQYQTCLGNGALLPDNIPIDEYCACYANEYAKIFENIGIAPDSRGLIQMQSAAHMRCRGRR